jgi:hypothetical protein
LKPTQSDVHVDRPLTSIVVAYMQSDEAFVASKVFPVVGVQHKSDTFYKWKRDDFWRVSAAERAPGTAAEAGGIELETGSYEAREYAVAYDLIDSIVANADDELRLEQTAAEYVAKQLLLKREQIFVTNYVGTGIWTGSSTGSDLTGVSGAPGAGQFKQWNDAASTPIEDIRAQMLAMSEKTAQEPNTLVLGPETWNALVDHPDLLDRIKYTQKGVVTTDLLASLLGLKKVVIGRAVKNTAKEGQTASYDFFHGKYALLLYSAPSPGINVASAGYIFAWTKRPGAGPEGQRVKRFRDEKIEADRIEGQMNFDMKVVCADMGVYFTSAVA